MKKTAQTIIKKSVIAGIVICLSALATYFLLAHTHAQEVNRIITIVPPSESITVNPGDKKEGTLKVINDSNTPLTFTANTQDFIVTDTKGTPDFVPEGSFERQFSAAAWIGVIPGTFTVAPHDKAILHYYLQVPKDARPGGHYAGILYTPSETLGSKTTGPAVQTQIGTLFSIDVSGPIHEQASITKFLAEHGFYEYGPVNIMTQIKNFGDLHIKPLGTITISDMFGRKLAVIPFDQHNIFPLAARDYINVFGQKWMFGPFTAKFVASYGREGNLPLTASMTFWVFPWKVTVLVVLAIIAAVMGYMVWKKKQQEKSQPPHQPHTEETMPSHDAPKA